MKSKKEFIYTIYMNTVNKLKVTKETPKRIIANSLSGSFTHDINFCKKDDGRITRDYHTILGFDLTYSELKVAVSDHYNKEINMLEEKKMKALQSVLKLAEQETSKARGKK